MLETIEVADANAVVAADPDDILGAHLTAFMATVEDALDGAVAAALDDTLDLAILAASTHLLPLRLVNAGLLARFLTHLPDFLGAAMTTVGLRKSHGAIRAGLLALDAHLLALDAGLLALAAAFNARLMAATTATLGIGLLASALLGLGGLSAAMSLVSALIGSRRGRNGQRRDTGR